MLYSALILEVTICRSKPLKSQRSAGTSVGIPVDFWLQILTYNPDVLVRSLHECLRSHKFKNLIQEQGILSQRDVHKLSSQYIKLALNICLVPFLFEHLLNIPTITPVSLFDR